ncbi:MAG: DUF3034 family protein [Pseudomonadota bacterium]
MPWRSADRASFPGPAWATAPLAALLLPCFAAADDFGGSRLLATAGATSIEGSAGGGMTPWAVLAGYGDTGEFGCAGAASRLSTDDYGLTTTGLACSLGNRVELSVAQQALDLDGLREPLGLPSDQQLRQSVVGLKVRIAGDIVYGRYGQVSMAVSHKDNRDEPLVRVAGATKTRDLEAYISAGKLFIDGPLGRMAYVNLTARWSRANQTGLLGFGGDRKSSRTLRPEAAVALLPRRDLAVGLEYRSKPDNLSFAGEDDWRDVFVAWFPGKHLSLVAAWVDLGSVGTLPDQRGLYVSFAGSF